MKCLVTVTDKGYQGGESVMVESNQTIEAFRPTLGDYQTYVDDVFIDQSTIGVTPSQLCQCHVQEDDPVLFPPKTRRLTGRSVQAMAASGVITARLLLVTLRQTQLLLVRW